MLCIRLFTRTHVYSCLLAHLGARRGQAVRQDAASLLAVDARVVARVHGRLAAALALAQMRRHEVLRMRRHNVVHGVACAEQRMPSAEEAVVMNTSGKQACAEKKTVSKCRLVACAVKLLNQGSG